MGCNTSQELSETKSSSNGAQDENNGDNQKIELLEQKKSDTNCEDNTLVEDSVGKNEARAAIKIQSVFRGNKARNSIKNKLENKKSEALTNDRLLKELNPKDEELCQAAKKIQSSFRLHLRRKSEKKSTEKMIDEQNKRNDENEIDVDLEDPELQKAVSKIQATFRSQRTRKEV